jgi:hypothetical protein
VGGPSLIDGQYTDGSGPIASVNRFDARSAFDRNSSRWTSGSPSPAYIGYYFSSQTDVREVAIKADSGGDAPKSFTIDYWDGTQWVVALDIPDAGNWNGGATKTFAIP